MLPSPHKWCLIRRHGAGPVLAFNPGALTLPEVVELCQTLGVELDEIEAAL